MLLDDDVVAERKAKPRPLARRFGREEWIEHFLLDLGRDAGAVVADPDFDTVTEIPGHCSKDRHVVAAIGFRLALGRSIKAI